MIEIKTYPVVDSKTVLRTSRALFRVTGNGVHNPEFKHRVVFYKSGLIALSAQAGVIADRNLRSTDVDGGTLVIGEHIRIDNAEYAVTARPNADPMLTLVRSSRKGPLAK